MWNFILFLVLQRVFRIQRRIFFFKKTEFKVWFLKKIFYWHELIPLLKQTHFSDWIWSQRKNLGKVTQKAKSSSSKIRNVKRRITQWSGRTGRRCQQCLEHSQKYAKDPKWYWRKNIFTIFKKAKRSMTNWLKGSLRERAAPSIG